MSLFLRIILLVASVLFAIYVIKKIRKSQMKIGDSIYWISLIVLIVTLSIFPNIIISLAKWIGIESPANLFTNRFLSDLFLVKNIFSFCSKFTIRI